MIDAAIHQEVLADWSREDMIKLIAELLERVAMLEDKVREIMPDVS